VGELRTFFSETVFFCPRPLGELGTFLIYQIQLSDENMGDENVKGTNFTKHINIT
jgi:hypothetical protein